MSDIFLSHSSADNAVATTVKDWLRDRGHRSVFLDFDERSGIAAGRAWERVLYKNLKSCRAVIVLCSEASMASRWVFAEITHARALGKHIFPVLIEPCTVDPILADHQAVDFARDPAAAFERLADGLGIAGIDTRDSFDWDRRRSPYPGLLAFDEKDAAIFFGRTREIGTGLDLLQQVSRYRGSGLIMVLGASGSGKSSLVRAGLLPRLRRDRGGWLIVGPFRPQSDPMPRLADALAGSFAVLGQERDARTLERDLLMAAIAAQRSPGVADPLVDLCDGLSTASTERPADWNQNARVLMIIDQFEELLGEDNPSGRRFLSYLRAALEDPDHPILVLATMRSDHLGILQGSSAMRGYEFRSLSLGPMPLTALREVIEKPAAMAEVVIQPDLVHAILEDAETADALPLVAFTLRELYEGFGADRLLELREYRDALGGLRGSVARAAEEVLEGASLSPEATKRLRQAFLKLTRINDEGQFTRRTATWDELPAEAHAPLERFVAARLLVARGDGDGRTLEVAHEAMFRAWDRYDRWLREGREELQLSHDVTLASRAWKESGRSEEYLLPAGRLQRVIELSDEDRLALGSDERVFIAAAQEAARRAQRRRRLWSGIAFTFLTVVALSMFYLWWLAEGARERTEKQASRVLAVQARALQGTQLDLSLLLSLRAFLVADTLESRTAVHAGLRNEPWFRRFLHGHRGRVWSVVFGPDGVTLGSSGDDATVRLWDLSSGRERLRFTPTPGKRVLSIDVSPDGRVLVAGDEAGIVSLWNTSSGQRREGFKARHEARVLSVAFDRQGRRIASGAADGTVGVWDVSSGKRLYVFAEEENDRWQWSVAFDQSGELLASADSKGRIVLHNLTTGRTTRLEGEIRLFSIAFSPDGRLLVAGRADGAIQFWDVASGEPGPRLIHGDGSEIRGVAYSPDGSRVAAAASGGTVQVWDAVEKMPLYDLPGLGGQATDVAFDPYGRVLASARNDGTIQIWDVWRSSPRPVMGDHDHRILAVAMSRTGRYVASSDIGGKAVVRDLEKRENIRLISENVALDTLAHEGEISGLAIHAEGSLVATGSGADPVRLWELPSGNVVAELKAVGEVSGEYLWDLAMDPDGRYLASANDAGIVRVWDTSTQNLLHELTSPGAGAAFALAFSPDAARLATVRADGGVHLWEVGGDWQRRELAGRVPEGQGLTFGLQGEILAAGDAKGRILIWDVATGRLLQELSEQETTIYSLAFRGDGLRLLSGGANGSLVLWSRDDVSQRFEPFVELLGHTSAVLFVRFDPEDGHRVLSASDRILIWDLEDFSDRDAVRKDICERAGRNLTRKEWALFVSAEEPQQPTCNDFPLEVGEASPPTR